MTTWRCGRCRAQVSPGAPRCPECPSTEFIEAEADGMLKISRDGTVSDSADARRAAVPEPEPAGEVPAVSVPAAEPEAAPAVPEPEPGAAPAPVPPRTPPRRSAPPAPPQGA